MGFKDLFVMFKTDTTKKFKVSVIVSIVLFIVMIVTFLHGFLSVRSNYVYDLNTHITIMYFSFLGGIIAFMVRNFSKHKFFKGLGLILLKVFVLLIAAYILYALALQTLIIPDLYINDTLFILATLISITIIKLILG
ncbi:MAG: hypothetical protein K8Q99_06000 [Acholeplasmataceae bacterium]|nr:hypothetical protein [Acholeplasmataceae bacterium]